MWDGDDWNSGTEEQVGKEKTPGNCLIVRGHLVFIQVKRTIPHHLECKLLLPLISSTGQPVQWSQVPLLSSQTHSPNRRPCSSLPTTSSCIWTDWKQELALKFLGNKSLPGLPLFGWFLWSSHISLHHSRTLEFLPAPGPCLYPNVPVERIHLHERTLLMNCPLAAAVSFRKDVFRSLPSTLHCDAISLRQEPC